MSLWYVFDFHEVNKFIYILFRCQLKYKLLYNQVIIIRGVYMKLKLLCLGLLALFLSGCMDSITAVPKAVIDGGASIVSSVWDAVTFWDN